MTMTGWAIGQKRKITNLVIGLTTYTFGTNFVTEDVTYNVMPAEVGNKTLLGGNKKYYVTKPQCLEAEATIILNTNSKNIITDLTSSNLNVNSKNAINITEYDAAGNAILTVSSSGNTIFTVSDITTSNGKITFKLNSYSEGVTIS